MDIKADKKYTAFNTHLLLIVMGFLCSICISIAAFSQSEYAFAVFFLFICLIAVFAFLVSPVYIVFTAEEITIVYLWGIKERIMWKQIRNISEYGSWIFRHVGTPEYCISYPQKEKYPFFVKGRVPRTRKTKKLIKYFYNKDIL